MSKGLTATELTREQRRELERCLALAVGNRQRPMIERLNASQELVRDALRHWGQSESKLARQCVGEMQRTALPKGRAKARRAS